VKPETLKQHRRCDETLKQRSSETLELRNSEAVKLWNFETAKRRNFETLNSEVVKPGTLKQHCRYDETLKHLNKR
jgi:hypothetical protein